MQVGDFLRRLNSADYIKEGIGGIEIKFHAFKCSKADRESGGLSWTKVSKKILLDDCEDYWRRAVQDHPTGGRKIPGLCFLTPNQIEAQEIYPSYVEDKSDPIYGKDHYQTPCVDYRTDDGKRILKNLAHHASQNGLLRPLQHPVKGQIPKRFVSSSFRRHDE